MPHAVLKNQLQTVDLKSLLKEVTIAAVKLDNVLRSLLGDRVGAKIDRHKHTY